MISPGFQLLRDIIVQLSYTTPPAILKTEERKGMTLQAKPVFKIAL